MAHKRHRHGGNSPKVLVSCQTSVGGHQRTGNIPVWGEPTEQIGLDPRWSRRHFRDLRDSETDAFAGTRVLRGDAARRLTLAGAVPPGVHAAGATIFLPRRAPTASQSTLEKNASTYLGRSAGA